MKYKKDEYLKNIQDATQFLLSKIPQLPSIAIVLGSGLGDFGDELTESIEIPYEDIPHFPVSTIIGHAGKLITGWVDDKYVLAMKGRFHFYEGYELWDVVFPIRVFKYMGIESLVLTNAAGGINPKFTPGTLMFIKDHIGLFCDSALRGPNLDEFGPRFNDCTHVYDPKYLELAFQVARDLNISVESGVYVYVKGPNYETPSDIRVLQTIGADSVGMSTVPEALVASHSGMRILGLSCISNVAAGILDQPLNHEEVMENGKKMTQKLTILMKEILKRL